MDLIIKVYNQYFRSVDSQRWKYVSYQYWYNVRNWCCTNAVHRYHFDCPRTVRFRQSEVDIQRWINVGLIVNFCLGKNPWGTGNVHKSNIIVGRKWTKFRRTSQTVSEASKWVGCSFKKFSAEYYIILYYIFL